VTDLISEAAAENPVPADALELTVRARPERLRLTGEGGLLSRLTKMVVESALEGGMEDHLGYARRQPAGGGNSPNGTRSKELLTEAGPVQIAVTRDRDSSFTPQLVRKLQRRLSRTAARRTA
jgi:putative transposase